MTIFAQIKTRTGGVCLILFALVVATTPIRGQVGNNNPTGPAGFFNGNINSGCSYDPLTGNSTRSLIDLTVSGAVGSYPLALSRTANSRFQQAGDFGFGQAGGWRHSYAWEIDGSETNAHNPSFSPTVYPVSFPDGRVINFTASPSDPYFRGPPGVRERFQPINFSTMFAYLILPDGGKVEFKATRQIACDYELIPPCEYSYSYQAQAIIDPYGLRTTLAYNTNGSLNTIQEPGLRWIQIIYRAGSTEIDHLWTSDNQWVQYNYSQASHSPGTAVYTQLDSVVYPYDSTLGFSPAASYSYQAPNGPNPNGYPLLASCDDPMYAGPMKKISYSYATSNGDPYVPVVVGQILSENNGNTGEVVSRLYIPFVTWRNEIRGDGPSRHFEYDGVFLRRFTDFNQEMATQGYDANSYLNAFIDRNHNTTDIVNEPLTGRPSQVTYPLTPSDNGVRANVQYEYGSANCPDPNNRDGNSPYYLYRATNERGNPIFYLRDVNKRVSQVNYPDGGFETLAYNTFNQVTSHRLRAPSASTAGGLETFVYDGNGRLVEYRDPYHPAVTDSQHPEIPVTASPSTSYGYDALGRMESSTDAGNHTTHYQVQRARTNHQGDASRYHLRAISLQCRWHAGLESG